ncbi:MAG TPA: acyltransferase [Fibrobacteria bacterium]|nr:acyltransferase [Fibrobacteria bacterium]
MSEPANQTVSRQWDPIPGYWKLLCALAVLVGHNLVTLTAWQTDFPPWRWIYHAVQFFSPYHFFLFSGYLACSSLESPSVPLGKFMLSRALRIQILVVAAFAWALGIRLLATDGGAVGSLGTIWPLDVWDGPIDWRDALMHLSPFGFADHTKINYATWYLYQELRIILLFPIFRWILQRPSSFHRWMFLALLWGAASVLEYKFWSFFPLFRSSPFQSLAYGCYFFLGVLARQTTRSASFPTRLPWSLAWVVLGIGVGVSFFESFSIRFPLSNPPILLVPIAAGQFLVVTALCRLLPRIPAPSLLRRACDWSVGIYIVHPPLHVVATWWAVRTGNPWPLVPEILLSIAGGALFHHLVERPSNILLRRLK